MFFSFISQKSENIKYVSLSIKVQIIQTQND